MLTLVSRRSALAGFAALPVLGLLAACKNPDGTPMTTRQILQAAVRVGNGSVSLAKVLIAGYKANCAQNPSSFLCSNAVVVAIVATAELGLPVLQAALTAAEAALDDTLATEERIGTALGTLLGAQKDIDALIERLGNDDDAKTLLQQSRAVREQAQFAGYVQSAYVPIVVETEQDF